MSAGLLVAYLAGVLLIWSPVIIDTIKQEKRFKK